MSDEENTEGENFAGDPDARRRMFERKVPGIVKRAIERAVEKGVETLIEAPENIRELIDDVKLPKEAAGYIFEQVDDTKKGVYKVVAKEIRDVLEHINFADEIAEVLTKLQFEINTTIRFVPNEDRPDGEQEADSDADGDEPDNKKRPSGIPRPKVVSKVVMKARDVLKPKE